MLSVPSLLSVGTIAIARFRIKITLYWPSHGITVPHYSFGRNVFVPDAFILPVTSTVTEQQLLQTVGGAASQHVHYLMKLGDNFNVSFRKDHKIQIMRFLCNALTGKQTSKCKGHLNCVDFCYIVKAFPIKMRK